MLVVLSICNFSSAVVPRAWSTLKRNTLNDMGFSWHFPWLRHKCHVTFIMQLGCFLFILIFILYCVSCCYQICFSHSYKNDDARRPNTPVKIRWSCQAPSHFCGLFKNSSLGLTIFLLFVNIVKGKRGLHFHGYSYRQHPWTMLQFSRVSVIFSWKLCSSCIWPCSVLTFLVYRDYFPVCSQCCSGQVVMVLVILTLAYTCPA